jgi:hypothetical protein
MQNDFDIPLDRVTYKDGQLLTAPDLRDDWRRDERLRRLHTRCLHETWGIALGLGVTAVNSGKALEVRPGHAVDIYGRDILLAETIQISLPASSEPEPFVLTARYREETAFRDHPDLAGLCLSGGLDPRHERPRFSWRRPEDVLFGPEVPLVQVFIVDDTVEGKPDFRVRRNARPLVRPHRGYGITEPGRTGWQLWGSDDEGALGLEVVVDTSEAGFTRKPVYFASLEGDFSTPDHPDLWPSGSRTIFFLDAFTFITDVKPDGFIFRIILRGTQFPIGIHFPADKDEAEERQWSVCWHGLEPVSGCEPRRVPGRVFTIPGVRVAARV